MGSLERRITHRHFVRPEAWAISELLHYNNPQLAAPWFLAPLLGLMKIKDRACHLSEHLPFVGDPSRGGGYGGFNRVTVILVVILLLALPLVFISTLPRNVFTCD